MSRNKRRNSNKDIEEQVAKVIKNIGKYLLILIRNKRSARKFVGSADDQDMEDMLREHRVIPEVVETCCISVHRRRNEGYSYWKIILCGGLIRSWSDAEVMLELTEKMSSPISPGPERIHSWDPKEVKDEIAELLIMVYALLLKLPLYLRTQGSH